VDYAEHARRRYSDSIQYFTQAVDYYDDTEPFARPSLLARFKARFRPHSRSMAR
jgi:polysaccharide biosynthesis transport protein